MLQTMLLQMSLGLDCIWRLLALLTLSAASLLCLVALVDRGSSAATFIEVVSRCVSSGSAGRLKLRRGSMQRLLNRTIDLLTRGTPEF